MTKFCGQVNIPTVNNDPIACTQFFDTDCVIYQNPIAYFGTNDPSTSTEVFDFIISSLIDARTRLSLVEGSVLPTTHADLLGLGADDHIQYLTDARGRALILTGLNVNLTGAIVPTDTLLEGLGKLQSQIDNVPAEVTGTWTPNLTTPTSAYTYNVNFSTYHKIGKLVTLCIGLSGVNDAPDPAGALEIRSLPFPASLDGINMYSFTRTDGASFSLENSAPTIIGVDRIQFQQFNGTDITNVTWTGVSNAERQLIFTIQYTTT